MIIQNFEELAITEKKKDCLEILESGLQAANPVNIISNYVTPNEIKIDEKIFNIEKYSNIYTIAFGKAGDSMTRAINSIISIKSGIIVIPKGAKAKIKSKKFQIFNSGHPKPDKTSVKAAKEVMKFVNNKKSNELIIFLVSGGGSSLLAMPDEITLSDKVHVTDLLLKSGATIQEFNCIRKHLSKIKGGKLVENMKCQGIGLIMSDVENDDLSSIASGTTYMDNTTYQDAMDIIEKYRLKKRIPIEVLQILGNGVHNQKSETPKHAKIENYIVANNSNCLESMEKEAKIKGYKVIKIQIFGDIKEVVKNILEKIPRRTKNVFNFWRRANSQSFRKRSGRKKSRISFENSKKYSEIKKDNNCIYGN